MLARTINQNDTPLITVAMPVFNAGHHLKLAVLSIVNQSFRDWELLIIDDGSTDNALQTLTDINDSRIQVIRDGLNKGLAARLNESIDIARGKYFARMDQDDVSYPERFSRQLELLQRDPSLDLVAASAIAISDNNEVTGLLPCPVSHQIICARPWQGFCLIHPTWMGNIEWFRKYRYANPGPYFCEDQELILRSYVNSKFSASEEILFAYRVRSKNNWNRVIKTRWTFFTIQFQYFLKLRNFIFAVLTIFVFIALISRDYLRMTQEFLGFKRYAQPNVTYQIQSKWQETLNLIGCSN